MREFMADFALIERYKILRVALFNESIAVIRFYAPEVVSMQTPDQHGTIFPSYFVFYDLETNEILSLYHNGDEELLNLYNRFYLDFRNAEAQHPNFIWRSMNNKRMMERIKTSTPATLLTCIRRTLSQIPPPCQAVSPSPYLDSNLFEYDSSLISPTDRGKTVGADSVRFYARDSMRALFELRLSGKNPRMNAERQYMTSHKKQVNYCVHPYDPLIISSVRDYDAGGPNMLRNLHIYREGFDPFEESQRLHE